MSHLDSRRASRGHSPGCRRFHPVETSHGLRGEREGPAHTKSRRTGPLVPCWGLYGDDVWGQIRKVKIRVDSGPGRRTKPGVCWLLRNFSSHRENIRVKPCRKSVYEPGVAATGSRRRAAGTRDNKEKQAGATPTLRARSKPPSPVSAGAPFNVLRAGQKHTKDRNFRPEYGPRGHTDRFGERVRTWTLACV